MDYRRMGNMEFNVGDTTSVTSSDQWIDQWKSPRWIVLRIEALVLVAIIINFFLASFGSSRRWSNRWIVQKGFFVAQALSLSFGTYSIGLMQSSSVKSEMYPIWTVSLFTLFGCIDPVTSYNDGFDYKAPLTKMVYGICLYCGYVMLMSISTMSSNVRSTAIIMLSAITFIKCLHRSLALVQQSRTQSMLQELDTLDKREYIQRRYEFCGISALRREGSHMIIDIRPNLVDSLQYVITLDELENELTVFKDERLSFCYDVCVAFSLSHELQRHFFGLVDWNPEPRDLKDIDYKWAMKVIEIELAFLYESIFTGNPFFYYYQAKTTSFWAMASFIGICFMGIAVAAAATPRAMTTRRHHGGSTCTNFVETTTADLVITFVVLVSLALLQLMHLIQCCTSNWARVAVACACVRNGQKERSDFGDYTTPYWFRRWLRLKVSVATSTNWFDKYLWQGKIGQCSVLRDGRLLPSTSPLWDGLILNDWDQFIPSTSNEENEGTKLGRDILVKILGLDYIREALRDLLGSDTNKTTRVDDDVKASVIEFLGQIKTNRLDESWLHFTSDRLFFYILIYKNSEGQGNLAFKYRKCVTAWLTATWLCQIAEAEQKEMQDAVNKWEQGEGDRQGTETSYVYYLRRASSAIAGCFRKTVAGGGERRDENRDRRVAIALSNYCTYLAVSAPELLPEMGRSARPVTMKRMLLNFGKMVRTFSANNSSVLREIRSLRSNGDYVRMKKDMFTSEDKDDYGLYTGLLIATDLFVLDPTRRWKIQSIVWVQLLVYAAPYGKVEAHMRHLEQGGEFITYLWALLYHLGIHEWKLPEQNVRNMNLQSLEERGQTMNRAGRTETEIIEEEMLPLS